MDPHALVNRDYLQVDGKQFVCTICAFKCLQFRAFDRHTERRHCCRHCGLVFRFLSRHDCPQRVGGAGNRPIGVFAPQNLQMGKFELLEQAHMGTITRFIHHFNIEATTVETGVNYLYSDLESLIMQMLAHFRSIKVSFKIAIKLVDNVNGKEKMFPTATPYMNILHNNFIETSIVWAVGYMLESINLLSEDGSGYSMDSVVSFEVQFCQLRQLRVGCNFDIPKQLARRQGFLNVKSDRNDCFMLSVLAYFYCDEVEEFFNQQITSKMTKKEKHVLQVQTGWTMRQANTYYDYISRIKNEYNVSFDGFDDGVTLEDLDEFEKLNSTISINVFGNYDKSFSPIRLTQLDRQHHINLILFRKRDLPENKLLSEWKECPLDRHFVMLRKPSALFASGSRQNSMYYCKWCLKRCAEENTHESKCQAMHEAKIKVFEEGAKFHFQNLKMKMDVPFRIYFDLECLNVPYDASSPNPKNAKVDTTKLSFTRAESNFRAISYGLSVVSWNNTTVFQHYYNGMNVIEQFLKMLFHLQDLINEFYNDPLPLVMNADEEECFNAATTCYECKRAFSWKNDKVAHHHHYKASFKVIPVCNFCNLQLQQNKIIPVLAHYGSGFDFHFILKSLTSKVTQKISIIPKNSEQFLSFSIGNLRFLDTCQFLNLSLEKLVLRLKGDGTPEEMRRFDAFRKGFNNHPHIDMLTEKQSFPYDWFDSEEKLKYPALPPHADFYNKLRDENITEEEYAHVQSVWEKFDCKYFEDYLTLYLKTDVLLLQCVFEHFVSTCMETYSLSPIFSYSLPGYAYHCASYEGKHDWEYITDVEMVKVLRENIRGGICLVTKRKSTAHSENLGDVVVDSAKRKELLLLDFTNLYGSQLLAPMPHSGLRWLDEEEIAGINIMELPECEDEGPGWIFEVDLEIDPGLHDYFNDLPPAPEKMKVKTEDISPQQHILLKAFAPNITNPLGAEKLLLTFYKKEKYAVYHRLLKYYVSKGVKITKIHRGFTFLEKPIFRNFIKKNIELRQNAKDEFSRSLYKLQINSIYGKILNIRPRTIIKLCNNRVDSLCFLAAHNFKSVKILSEETSLFIMEGAHVKIDKPIAAGYVVLELSKLLLYRTYFDVIVKQFGSRVHNLYTDTDSLLLEVMDPERRLNEDLLAMKEYMDFSSLPESHPLYLKNDPNKGKAGTLKIELCNIREFIGLKAKCYSLLLICTSCRSNTVWQAGEICQDCSGKIVKLIKCKGVPKKCIKNITHDNFRAALDVNVIQYIEARRIQARSCVLELINYKKVSLHNMDFRRYILDDNLSSYAYGHYRIEKE